VTASSRLTAGAKAAAAELNPEILEDAERFAQFRQDYKDTQQNIRNLDFGDNPYKNAEMLAGTYEKFLLSHAADQGAAAEALSALQGSDAVSAYDVEGTQLASLGGPITVSGKRYRISGPALGLKMLDTLSIQAGNLGMKLGKAYNEMPTWAKYGVTALGLAVDAAGGPVVFAARQVLGKAMGEASDSLVQSIGRRFLGKGYNAGHAALGGAGAVLIGTIIAGGGISKAKSLLASGFVSKAINRFNGFVQQFRQAERAAHSHGFQYHGRVRDRGLEDPKSHNFPYSYDDDILKTTPIHKPNGYRIYKMPGNMGDKHGNFEIGVTKDGVIDHRFFRPKK
jgi:hypothetical protein